MGNVYSKLLFEGPIDSSGTILFEVPTGHVYVIRDIEGFWTTVSVPSAGWLIIQDTDSDLNLGGILIPHFASTFAQNYAAIRWQGRQVFEELTVCYGNISGDGDAAVRVCGYDLLLP